MKTFIIALFFLTAILASESAPAKVEESFIETEKKDKDFCNAQLFRNFRKFTIKHNVRNLLIKRINYVEATVHISVRNMRGCEHIVDTSLFCVEKKSKTLCSRAREFKKIGDSLIKKVYRFKVADIHLVRYQTRKVRSVEYSEMRYMLQISNRDGAVLKEHTFRDYISIDETTGASNSEETQADTDVYYAGPRISDEDFGDDKDLKDIDKYTVKINLKTVLICYTHPHYRNVNTKKNALKPGDIGYCELKF